MSKVARQKASRLNESRNGFQTAVVAADCILAEKSFSHRNI